MVPKLPYFETRGDFCSLWINAYVQHHVDFNCRNINLKCYQTSCKYMGKLISGWNGNLVFNQVCDAAWYFYARTRECQKIIIKEWLRHVLASDLKVSRRKPNVSFVIFLTTLQSTRNLFKVRLNNLGVLYGYGYDRIKTLRDDLKNAGMKVHGLKNRTSTQKKPQENWRDPIQVL